MSSPPILKRVFLLVAFALWNAPAAADDFVGRVIRIVDGDSIIVLHNERQIDVRLEGIDCPESGQAFGRRAKRATADMAFGKTVDVKATGKDRYGRTLGHVVLPDEIDLNRELVRRGYAWWFHKYSDDEMLQRLEAEARKAKVGLWSDDKPVAPWDWRAARRAKIDVPPNEIEIVPNGIVLAALLPNPEGVDAGREQVTIHNATTEQIDLSGWKLIDLAGNVFLLSGSVDAGQALRIRMAEATMPLNNDGDTVALVDADGVGRSRVSYDRPQARSGLTVRFGR